MTRKKSPLIAPRGMRFNDAATYLSLGKRGLDNLIRRCQLRPEHKVLDVGCGSGSMALPLMGYLTTGSYEGFDIVRSWTTWCSRHFTRRNPRFRFQFIDVYSRHYNSPGKLSADTLKFPYNDSEFDCVLLESVFTHMRPAAIRNYIHELARVMKPGARGFITTLLLNEESEKAIERSRSAFPLVHRLGDCRIIDPEFPETAIAIPENEVMAWFSEAGFRIGTVIYGSWAGRSDRENLHDDLVVEKL